MARSPIHYSMCRLLALPSTLRVEIQCHHRNPYFLKDPKGCALVQDPFLDTGPVPDHHIPGQDQGPQAVDPLQGKAVKPLLVLIFPRKSQKIFNLWVVALLELLK